MSGAQTLEECLKIIVQQAQESETAFAESGKGGGQSGASSSFEQQMGQHLSSAGLGHLKVRYVGFDGDEQGQSFKPFTGHGHTLQAPRCRDD